MLRQTHLILRHRSYYVRVRVPAYVVPILRRSHVVRTLRTTDYVAAKERAASATATILRAFRKISDEAAALTSRVDFDVMTIDEINEMPQSSIDALSVEERSALAKRFVELVDVEEAELATLVKEREKKEGYLRELKDAYSEACHERNLGLEIRGKHVNLLLQKEQMELQRKILAKLTSFEPTTTQPTQHTTATETPVSAPIDVPKKPKLADGAKKPWHEHIAPFFQFNRHFGTSTKATHEMTFRVFKDTARDIAISDLDKNHIVAFMNGLLERNTAKHGKAQLSAATIKKYLSNLNGFFEWSKSQNLRLDNPALGVAPPKDRRAESDDKRDPFSDADLVKIFHAPLFTGCFSPDRPHDKGDTHLNNSLYWFPLVAIFTGMRIEEITSLRVTDVEDIHGISCFRVKAYGIGKTKNAKRNVPVHPELNRLGFYAFLESRQGLGNNELLFEQRDYSKFFNDRFFVRLGIKQERLVLYSFRHNFKSMIRPALRSDELCNRLMGHSNSSIGERYGRPLTVDEMNIFISEVKPPISFTHLYPDQSLHLSVATDQGPTRQRANNRSHQEKPRPVLRRKPAKPPK